MQSLDLGKPQIPPTFLAGRDFGLFFGDYAWLVAFCERMRTLSNTRKHFYVAFQIIGVYLFYINSYKSISYTFLQYIGIFEEAASPSPST